MEAWFQRSFPVLIEWQWGSLIETLTWLLDLEGLIRQTWSGRAFQGGRNDQTGALATSAIADPLFWAYSHMCWQLQRALEQLAWWAESCACHPASSEPHKARGARRSSSQKHWAKLMGDGLKSSMFTQCPMRGKRAPELACHAVVDQMQQAFDGQRAQAAYRCLGLSEDETGLVLQDYALAQSHDNVCHQELKACEQDFDELLALEHDLAESAVAAVSSGGSSGEEPGDAALAEPPPEPAMHMSQSGRGKSRGLQNPDHSNHDWGAFRFTIKQEKRKASTVGLCTATFTERTA